MSESAYDPVYGGRPLILLIQHEIDRSV
ncbi:hypothetical protein AABM27_16975 [Heyndrickxia faecalis]